MAKRLRHNSSASTEATVGLPESSRPGREAYEHKSKYANVGSGHHIRSFAMRCSLPPHEPLNFSSYSAYESHFVQTHTFRCRECHKNFPNAHFLDLHISEHHDPIVAAKLAQGPEKIYRCFVEDCEKVCADWKKRRSHLVDKHGFPKNYDFLIVNSGIDGKRSMLRRGVDVNGHRSSSREGDRRSSTANEAKQMHAASPPVSIEDGPAPDSHPIADAARVSANDPKDAADVGMDNLTSTMSALRFVPPSVTFGRRKGKAGFSKQ